MCLQGGSVSSSGCPADCNGGTKDLQMSENLIYYSREDGEDTDRTSCSTKELKDLNLNAQFRLCSHRSQRVLGERSANGGVGALRVGGQLLAQSRERHADPQRAKDQEECPGVAL